jgi:hypothetical protein
MVNIKLNTAIHTYYRYPIIYKLKKCQMITYLQEVREQGGRYRYAAKSITFPLKSNVKYNLSLSMHSWHILPSLTIKQQCHLTTCPVHCNLSRPSGAQHHLAPAKSTVRLAEEKTDVHRKTGFNLCNCTHCKMHLQKFMEISTSS